MTHQLVIHTEKHQEFLRILVTISISDTPASHPHRETSGIFKNITDTPACTEKWFCCRSFNFTNIFCYAFTYKTIRRVLQCSFEIILHFFLSIVSPWKKLGKAEVENPRLLNLFQPLVTVIVYNSAADCRQTGRSLSTYHVHNIRFCSNTVGFYCVQQNSRQTGRSNSTDRVKMLLTGILY